jgi:plastocyanin
MRKLLACTLALALLGAAGSQAIARPAKSVKVGDDFFVRKGSAPTVTVKRGTKVTWKWAGKSLHNVHARKGPATFRSSSKTKGSFSKVMRKPGTYKIVCDIHGPSMKMTLKVTR